MKRLACRLFGAVFAVTACAAHGQGKPAAYPAKPVRIVVGIAPGGGLDTMTRLGAQKLSERWASPSSWTTVPEAARWSLWSSW